MVVKVNGGSAGSCGGLVNYLEKQERGQWFSQERDGMRAGEVTPAIDGNKRNLGRDDEKFYQIIIGPSREELKHIGDDPAKLRDYTRDVMNEYARNFGKGIEGKDLVWFAKIEKERTHTHSDRAVQTGEELKGKKKEGEQTHVHVIVSRTENLSQFKARQQAGEMERKHPLKLSPATNHRATEKGAVKGGFDRTNFIRASERQFDQKFSYERKPTETFEYSRNQQHGTQAERVAEKLAVIRAESHRQEQERQAQRQAAERRAAEQQKAKEQGQNQQQQRARGEEKTQEPQQRPQQTPPDVARPKQTIQQEPPEIKRRGPRL
ncbi:DUF5712 family protein [Spirosoma sordidisoli]|uniref:Mobilization protein n=1 Tax=Spirosoma sordidisoli TaxID=2502893 RepID=A0A4Q2UFU8_9BACT|nr:DUF5712 family protein [Spirosoma sordidisoli]RYC66241.1 hypothetical protein EQG79_30690 [Spirosoma sordidisoli]